jgi:response regulator of citrate/malate metabolism
VAVRGTEVSSVALENVHFQHFIAVILHSKGIDELTLDKVKEAFISAEVCHTAESLGELIGISKTTARRYLEHCAALSFVYAEVMHGKVGRPERVYRRHG